MRYEARFVVETHGHITTLYKPKGKPKGEWTGLPRDPDEGEVEAYDNSTLCLYDMERYGVDMVLLKPSMPGTTNEGQLAIVEKYPDKFRSFCTDQKLRMKVARGEAKWTLDAAAEEVEAALKTGKYIGIGEFVPMDTRREKIYTFKERLDEYRVFAQLALKYDVTLDFHDFAWGHDWDCYALLSRIAKEYPKVSIVFCHGGYSIGAYAEGASVVRKGCAVAGMSKNIYLETGTWPAEFYEIALKDPNVGPTQLLWGGDYGHVPQYIVSDPGREPSSYSTAMKRWAAVPTYQADWWGWELHQIHKIRDWVTQDVINLILGGNAARVFKLPVPHERMFLDGRPDIYGIHWRESVPFIPENQIQHPDMSQT